MARKVQKLPLSVQDVFDECEYIGNLVLRFPCLIIYSQKSVEQTLLKFEDFQFLSGAYCKPLSPCPVIDTLTGTKLTSLVERSQAAVRLQCHALTLARISQGRMNSSYNMLLAQPSKKVVRSSISTLLRVGLTLHPANG